MSENSPLKRMQEKTGLPDSAFSRMLNITESDLAAYTAGDREIPIKLVQKMKHCGFLVNVSEFLGQNMSFMQAAKGGG